MNQPVADAPTTYEAANPDWVALDNLLHAVQAAQHSLATALTPATQTMSGGSAWTGPTAAKAFTTEIEGRDGRLPGLVQQIVQAVEDELAVTHKTVTRPINRGMRAE